MAKADASRSVDLAISQVFGGGGSAQVNYTFGTASLTTSWTRYTYTVALSSISGKTIGTADNLELDFKLPVNTVMTIEVADVQVEAANTASPFQTATGSTQGELAACQRYYYAPTNSGANTELCNGYYGSATQIEAVISFPVTMRVNPTMTSSNTAAYFNTNRSGAAVDTFANFSQFGTNPNAVLIYNSSVSGKTVGLSFAVAFNNALAILQFSAEL
jgi:hypothetical protein